MKKSISRTTKSHFLTVLAVTALSLPVIVRAQFEGGGKLNNPLQVDTIQDFLLLVIQALQTILFPVVTIMIIYSGFMFVTARGDVSKLTKAKTAIWYAIIGAAIILGAELLAAVISETITNLGS